MAAKKAKKPAARPRPNHLSASRPYTGYDGDGTGVTPGLQVFIREANRRTGGALWNNGDFGIRPMKGKTTPSVHSTGRAVDLSYRKTPNRGVPNGRAVSEAFINKCLEHANEIGIELVIDYWPAPFGRAWRCDRQAWKTYDKPTVSGAPGGDWWHVELSPAAARNPEAVKAAISKAFGDNPPQP